MFRLWPPREIPITHDDYHASDVGFTGDGRQFFVTEPFVPATDESPGREFLAVYLFDPEGTLLEARIDDLGTRDMLDSEQAARLRATRIAELGAVQRQGIRVRPFEIQRHGQRFGLVMARLYGIPIPFFVILVPGDYMAFRPPWNGEYDT